jgi:hypothetical protein
MITVNELIKELTNMVLEDKRIGDLPIIYSADDEGNAYQKVHNLPSLYQVENIEDYYLEISDVDEESEEPNCVIIN